MSRDGAIASVSETAAHPASPRASARGGARRYPEAVKPLLRPVASQEEVEALVREQSDDKTIRSAQLLLHRERRVTVVRVGDLPSGGAVDLTGLWPIRRIASVKKATNRMSFWPAESEGRRILLETESSLELAHLQDHELNRGASSLLTQPFAIRWPVGDKFAWHVPDLTGIDDAGRFVADVKPEATRDDFHRLIFTLTAATLERIGVSYRLLGSVSDQRLMNLNALAARRWPRPGLVERLRAARDARRRSLGGVIDSAGGDANGIAASLHLLTQELTANLDLPLTLGSPVEWGPR